MQFIVAFETSLSAADKLTLHKKSRNKIVVYFDGTGGPSLLTRGTSLIFFAGLPKHARRKKSILNKIQKQSRQCNNQSKPHEPNQPKYPVHQSNNQRRDLLAEVRK